ncbi:MAG TPA: hypothetical protein VNH11_21235 [Pirellulales bacterium]|nr:hypothetical protein [Pirellulales bacterium]
MCLFAALTFACGSAAGQGIELAAAKPSDPIRISAEQANTWKEGSYDVYLLRGHCVVAQGHNVCRARDAVVWVKTGDRIEPKPGDGTEKMPADSTRLAPISSTFNAGDATEQKPGDGTEKKRTKVIAYLEGDVQIEAGRRPRARQGPLGASNDRGWLGRFLSTAPVEIDIPRPQGEPTVKPAFYENAVDQRKPSDAVTRTQYVPSNRGALPPAAHIPPPPGSQPQQATATPVGGVRHLRIFPRGDQNPQIVWETQSSTGEGVAVITGGVQIFIDVPEGQLDISADKVVAWTVGDLGGETRQKYQDETVPLEVYLEGNVVFRQGDRVIYADRMYYDVKNKTGTILQAEITAPAPGYGGMIRLKSDIVRQVNDDTFYARHSYLTSSRLGKPRFRIQSSDVRLYDRQRAQVSPFTGSPIIDPNTHEQVIEHDQMVTGKNNTMFIGPVPVFWWPRFTTTLDKPSTVLRTISAQQDGIFGYWFEADFNAWQLLGLKPREGYNWTLTASEVTKRGYGAGTNLMVNRKSFLGIDGPVNGFFEAWGLRDRGLDNLGRTRIGIEHPGNYRGRVLGQFRQQTLDGYQITTELGLASDYNFLEQYYEAEYEMHKDETTDVEIKKITENREWTAYTQARVNPFFTQTNWLPRLDHYTMGQSLLGDRVTWFEHSNGGYAQFLVQQTPPDVQDQQYFNYLPWETANNATSTTPGAGTFGMRQGDRLASRQEVDAPLELGPVKVVPYALGEVAQWGQNLQGQNEGRVFGQLGVRSSILFWAANPTIESNLFNVHGVAHKVVFDVDAFAADANQNFTSLALYDPIDDNNLDRFRRRFMTIDYGGTLPTKFDPRYYAFRSGIQNFVASPTTEIAGSLDMVRLGMRHRWQTKRGPVGNRRIVDWIVLDSSGVYYPNPNRDNFGQSWGLVNYDLRWHVGDRLTLLSDASADFFYQGQKTWSVGATLSRAPRVNLYAGIRSFSGPFTYNSVTVSQSYQLSPKWMATASTSFALNNQGNIGENFSFTRIGEAFVTNVAFYVDGGKQNQGINVNISPRFLGQQMMQRTGAGGVPQAGMNGLQ